MSRNILKTFVAALICLASAAWAESNHRSGNAQSMPHTNQRLEWPFVDRMDRLDRGWLHLHYGYEFEVKDMGGMPWCCFGPTPLKFARDGNRWWVSEQKDVWRLAGVLVQSDLDVPDLEQALGETDSPLTVWCNPECLRRLPKIRNRHLVNSIVVWGGHGVDDLSPVASFPELRSLYVRETYSADLSALEGLKQLEVLTVKRNHNVVQFDPLCLLPKLAVLGIGGPTFDSVLYRLSRLQSLHLSMSVPRAGLTAMLANNPNLERLKWHVRSQDDLIAISRISGLKALELRGSFTDLSPLADLKHLRTLKAYSTAGIGGMSAVAGMPELRSLFVDASDRLVDVSPLAEVGTLELEELWLFPPLSVSQLQPILENCPRLSHLTVNCEKLTAADFLASAPQLESLRLSNCTALADISALRHCHELKKLGIASENRIKDFAVLAQLRQLEAVDLAGLADLEALSHCRRLAIAKLFGPMSEVGALAKLDNLISLDMSHCRRLRDVSAFSAMPQLGILNLNGCRLKTLWPPPPENQMVWLDLSGTRIASLSPLSDLRQLRDLKLVDCARARDIKSLAALPRLWSLDLSEILPSDRVLNVSVLADSTSLRSLSLAGNDRVRGADISRLTRLTFLDLTGDDQLEDLRCVEHMQHLESLSVGGCSRLRDLSPLLKLPNLRHLDLSGCEELKDFSILSRMPQLTQLNLEYTEVSEVSFVKDLPKLVRLDLHGCHQLQDVRPLKPLLRRLDLVVDKRLADQLE